MKAKSFKKILVLIGAGVFSTCLSYGQTTGLSGTSANSQLAGTLGTDNTNLGANSGNNITAGGNQNVNIGKDAGTAITTADDNTNVGFESGKVNTTGYNNCFIGSGSGKSNVEQHDNTFVGFKAGFANGTGPGEITSNLNTFI